MSEPDLTSKERAAAVAWRMAQGGKLTTTEIARDYKISRRGAARLLKELSRVIPIARTDQGCWADVELIIIGGGEGGDSEGGK